MVRILRSLVVVVFFLIGAFCVCHKWMLDIGNPYRQDLLGEIVGAFFIATAAWMLLKENFHSS